MNYSNFSSPALLVILTWCLLCLLATAQNSDRTINDLSGNWRIEDVDATYHTDDLVLRWENSGTLISSANGWTLVRWVRDEDLIG